MLAPGFTTKAEFKLGPSVYDGLPLTGGGTIQLAGSRILPSRANLSVAGNQVDLQGSFGARGDRLRFHIDAPALERLGFGLAGMLAADGDLTGSFDHPNVVLNYKADSVVLSSNRIGHAEGHAEAARRRERRARLHDGRAQRERRRRRSRHAHRAPDRHARQSLARSSRHRQAAGSAASIWTLAANGKLTEARDGTRWDGTVTRLQNPRHARVESRVAACREAPGRAASRSARRGSRSKARC